MQNQNFIQEQINIFEKAFQSLNNHYITQSESSNFIRFSEEILHKLKKTHISKKDKIYPEYVDIKQKLKSIQTIIENLNKSFINKKSIEYDSFLSDIDGKSLDIQ